MFIWKIVYVASVFILSSGIGWLTWLFTTPYKNNEEKK